MISAEAWFYMSNADVAMAVANTGIPETYYRMLLVEHRSSINKNTLIEIEKDLDR